MIIVVNFKTYQQGKNALKLTKLIELVDKNAIVCVQATDISEISKKTKLKVYAQGKKVKGALVTAFDVELLFIAKKKGYKIKEVPIIWHHVATSRVSPLKDSLRMFRDVVKVRLNDLKGVYNSK